MKNKKAKKKGFLRQQITSMVMTLMVVFCSTVVSATMWFQQSFETDVPTAPYEMRLELVKELDQPYVGENLLWSSGVTGVQSLDVIATIPQVNQAHLIVSNVYGYEDTVLYEVQMLTGETHLLDATLNTTGKKHFLNKGQSFVFENINMNGNGQQEVRFLLHTALADQSIYTASSIEQLTKEKYPVKSVVYATEDIIVDGDVVFENNYPNVNLAGHTFSCNAFTLSAPKGAFGSLTIGNGTLKIGGKQYTNEDVISCVGEGNVIMELWGLQS